MAIYNAQVMMLGGRRCGKTSVLAAMKANFDDAFEAEGITTTYGNMETLQVLEDKREELLEYFGKDDTRSFTPDANPTAEKTIFQFVIGLQGKNGAVTVDFVDYPGEYLRHSEQSDGLVEMMRQSQCVVIAIDTPHMMEENGAFNERKNYSKRICEMLKMVLKDGDHSQPDQGRKMFLFVPLKCEKYSNENRMDEVIQSVRANYKSLIDVLEAKRSKYEVAITPIFTLGCDVAQFSRFERNLETGEIKLDPVKKTPQKAIYGFLGEASGPNPQYCEQPVAYLLAYLMQRAGAHKKEQYRKKGFWGKAVVRVQENIFGAISESDLFAKRDVIQKKIKQDGDGYLILQDPVKLRSKY